MSPRLVLGQENVPCVAEVVNRSLKADCTDFNYTLHEPTFIGPGLVLMEYERPLTFSHSVELFLQLCDDFP